MTQYRSIRRTARRTEFDRNTWAEPAQLILFRDVAGVGEVLLEIPEFGMVFDQIPFFSYGVELQAGEILAEDDYPFVSCGVAGWVTNEEPVGDEPVRYLGANLWCRVVANTSYRFRLQLSFEAVAYKNIDLL